MSGIKAADTHESPEAPARGGSLWILVSLICLLLAYPLSMGPALRCFRTHGVPVAARVLYAPIIFAYEHNDKLRQAFDWYVSLWGCQM